MDLSDEEIEDFRKAWKEDFKEDIRFEGARTELDRLLVFLEELYDAFYGPNRPEGDDDWDIPAMSL